MFSLDSTNKGENVNLFHFGFVGLGLNNFGVHRSGGGSHEAFGDLDLLKAAQATRNSTEFFPKVFSKGWVVGNAFVNRSR